MDRDKEIITYAFIALAGILVIAGIVYFNTRSKEERAAPLQSKPQGTVPDEVLKNLTAPQTAKPAEVPEEVIKSLTAPASGSKKLPAVPEEVLKDLTAPR